ncbi:MAG: AAA family ATPase [Clostridia bacterium]|nr:AAA family ATPase [Clostridia bacterium]
MGRIVAFSNQKGGVGKTTTAINIATFCAKKGKKVLLVDFDPQGNASSSFGIQKNKLKETVYDLLVGRTTPDQVVYKTDVNGLNILPSNVDLAAAEVELVGQKRRECFLRDALSVAKLDYDYIMIDCPPSLGLLTLNALVAADSVIIPIQSEFFALEGLTQLVKTIQLVKQRLNPSLVVGGVILTMNDTRSIMSRQVSQEIKGYFGDKVYETTVPRNIKLCEAPSFGIPVSIHAPKSNGAIAYAKIADEFIKREV